MFSAQIHDLAQSLVSQAAASGYKIAVAESCTGGLLGGAITAVSGSSSVFDRGFITYSNEAKNQCLNVELEKLDNFGAVSPEVATAMVKGLFENTDADLYCSITGVAGPSGGSAEKPVGTVYIGIGKSDIHGLEVLAHHNLFSGDREQIREQSLRVALELMLNQLN
ncbi:MAG: CinA family protein [Alphaproteobacteria bacterium]